MRNEYALIAQRHATVHYRRARYMVDAMNWHEERGYYFEADDASKDAIIAQNAAKKEWHICANVRGLFEEDQK